MLGDLGDPDGPAAQRARAAGGLAGRRWERDRARLLGCVRPVAVLLGPRVREPVGADRDGELVILQEDHGPPHGLGREKV